MTTMLYIDDIQMNILTLEGVIESADKEYRLLSALSAKEGLSLLLKHKEIELIFLDVMMPEIDGYECAQMIRSNKKTKDIPIIFVTAKTDDASIQQCYESGGNDYISKPFNPTELLARTQLHLQLLREKRKLLHEKKFVQNILDMHHDYVCVLENKTITYANKNFYNFFAIKNLTKFPILYPSLYAMLLKEEKQEILFEKDKREYYFKINKNAVDSTEYIILEDISEQKIFEHEANYDALTQIYNRNKLNKILQRKLHSTTDETFCFVILDIDHFKQINDTYGHQTGDIVLANLSKFISQNIRPNDVFARWGGEEFILLLDASLEITYQVAEHLRELIEKHSFLTSQAITCSFGLTQSVEKDTIERITSRADKALYEAKNSGRNKVCKN